MLLKVDELKIVTRELRKLAFDAPPQRIESFVSTALGLSPAEKIVLFPVGDDLEGLVVGQLTEESEQILKRETSIPTFAIYEDAFGTWTAAGFGTYLAQRKFKPDLIERLKNHKEIRKSLLSLAKGHDLEVLGAAILANYCDFGEATRGSGDQGIDAIGKLNLIQIDAAFYDGGLGSFTVADPIPGNNVYLLASSKAVLGGNKADQKVINPAHIRELVGSWLIQRDDIGKWREIGIRMLSPLQLILISTYRLSDDSINECRKLGIQVWGVPQLIYLICESAPSEVFDPAQGHRFSSSELRKWWQTKDATRMKLSLGI